MYYAILAFDGHDVLALRRELRPAHLLRVEALRGAGRVLTAGPMPAIDAPDPGPAGFIGSLLVIDFSSKEEALAWAASDPYRIGGVWARIEVHPYMRVF